MKKLLLAAVLIIALGGYAYWSSTRPSDAAVAVNDPSSSTSAPSETTNPAANGTGSTGSTGTTGSTGSSGGSTASTGTYKDGTYQGSVADAFYGNLQVSATISGGKITDVTFIQYPSDQGESRQVNGRSNPILRSEAIAAQSAQVNIVSGATQSSEAFRQSLAAALTQAQS